MPAPASPPAFPSVTLSRITSRRPIIRTAPTRTSSASSPSRTAAPATCRRRLSPSAAAPPPATRVVYVNVTNGGTWTSPPTVSISGCSTPPTAEVSTSPSAGLTSGSYSVTGVTITSPGSGCTGPMIVNFSGPGAGGAVATAVTGPAPGDTITYVLTLTATGTADSTGCVINGTVPSYTTYASGGTFNLGNVSSTSTTLIPGASTTLTYTVTVDSALPNGVTALGQTGSATSTNTTSPPNVTSSLNTGATPRYTISDT